MFYAGPLQKKNYNHSSFAYEEYRNRTNFSYYILEIRQNLCTDLILKWETVKNCCKYKERDKNCNLSLEEKLAIAFYNNSNKLL